MHRLSPVFVAVLLSLAKADYCARDGSDYTYTESLSSSTRTITSNGCPNHPWYQLNPNKPYKETVTYQVPAYPQFVGTSSDSSTSSANIDLSELGGEVGVLFNGGMLFSPYGGANYGAVTGHTNSATYAEGDTFDQCGCHASSTEEASYHCHVPPSCLLEQLGQVSSSGTTSGSHSPQVGWADDGFPVYGPHGPGGVMMQTCTQTGGTYGTDVCTDDCGGYYSADGSIDDYVYRYYIQGTYNDGTSCDNPSCPSPGSAYYPHTPVCYRGCCPDGATCSNSKISTCSGTYADGYISNFTPSVPTINNLSLASGLPLNSDACSCSSLTDATCSDEEWTSEDDGIPDWSGQEESCPSSSDSSNSSDTSMSSKGDVSAAAAMSLSLLTTAPVLWLAGLNVGKPWKN